MKERRISVFAKDDAVIVGHKPVISPNAARFVIEMNTESPIQGRFETSMPVLLRLEEFTPQSRARLATMFLDLQAAGNLPQHITVELIEQARSRQPLAPIERAERLLRFLYGETTLLGKPLHFGWGDSSAWGLFIHSESTSQDEARFLLDHLKQEGLITIEKVSGVLQVIMTVEGLTRVAEQAAAPDSSQAFVAMWFDPSVDSLCSDGIEPAVRDAGYVPFRVDRQPTLHRIDDQIIAEIRKSRFIVADFTQGDTGARGSVFYEAGFAHGLGLPVIFTCRQDQYDDLHFDTRQYPHIGWTEPADLREPLKHRIEALIGRGPNADEQT